jgi:hypothetical protein
MVSILTLGLYRKVKIRDTEAKLNHGLLPITIGFCSIIEKSNPLLFSIYNGTIYFNGPFTDSRPWLRDLPSVSITEVLTNSKLSKKMRLRLSYVIAKAVWQYYDTDWMSKEWTREDIKFMLERDDYYDKPCLFADEPFLSPSFHLKQFSATVDDVEATTMPGRIHRFPKILALAILLLEIEPGSPIEKY